MSPAWDERYGSWPAPTEPSRFLKEFAYLLPTSGDALDAACGGGRNSVFLAKAGMRVTAVDSSARGLDQARELAQQHALEINWVHADLETFDLPVSAYDLAIVFYFRHPKFYARLRTALRPGGMLIYQTFTRDQLQFAKGPRNPEHLLKPGELLTAFADWKIVFYRETTLVEAMGSLVARKPKT